MSCLIFADESMSIVLGHYVLQAGFEAYVQLFGLKPRQVDCAINGRL